MRFIGSHAFRLWSAFLVFGLFSFWASPVLAQDDLDFSEMSLEDLLNVEVTVASKSEETVADAPSSVTVFTRQEILNMGVTSIEELMNYVPGFQMGRTEEDGILTYTVSARGRRFGNTSADILFLINGQRLNDAWTGGALMANSLITVGNVKQIEVIRGPGSALYGSNAFLGVVNIVTLTDSNQMQVSMGTFDHREGYINAFKEMGKWKVSGFVRSQSDNGDVYDRSEFGWPADTSDGRSGLDMYTTIQSDRLSLNLRFSERTQDDFPLYGQFGNNYNEALVRDSSVNLSYQVVEKENFSLKLFGSYGENQRDDKVVILPPGVGQALGIMTSGDSFLSGELVNQRQTSFSADSSFNLGNNSIAAGITWREATMSKASFQSNVNLFDFFALPAASQWPVEEYGFIQETGFLGQPDSRDVLGLYIQDKIKFNEHITATVGLRYDDYSDFGSTTNPRGGLVFKAFEGKSTFKVLYGQAFRAPSFKQQSEKTIILQGNPDLQPETVKTIEGVWIQKFGNVQFGVTYFKSEIEDGVTLLLSNVPDPAGGTFQLFVPTNELAFDLSGIEFEILASVKGFTFKGNYTAMSDTEPSPRKLGENLWSMVANYSYGKLNFNISGYYHDEVESPTPNENGSLNVLSDFTLFNGKIRYAFTENFDIFINARNMGDEDYRTVDSSAPFPNGIPNRGGAYHLGANLKF